MTILYFIIALGVLIFFHELGHFIFAKRAGVFVEVFSLGFGPRLCGVKIGETDYRISLFPLGGYVKMHGEEPGDEGGSDPRSFANKSVWARAKVILFGPLMNLFLCLLFMPVVYMIGRAQPAFLAEPPVMMEVKQDSPAAEAGFRQGDLIVSIDGKETKTWDDVLNKVLLGPHSTLNIAYIRDGKLTEQPVKVGELPEFKGGYLGVEPVLFLSKDPSVDGVRSGGPADMAGIKVGDRIFSFNGQPVDDWLDLTKMVNESEGKEADLVVERGEEKIPVKVAATLDKDSQRWIIGISKDRNSGVPMAITKLGFVDAVVKGTKENIKLAKLTFDVLGRLVTLKLSFKVLGGPIVIAKTSAAAASAGLSNFIYFMAFLSLQLAILNFLPIPVLDGGLLLFLAIEAVLRRPLSARVRMVAHQVGFVLLISLMVAVTINDIDSVWGLRSLFHKIF